MALDQSKGLVLTDKTDEDRTVFVDLLESELRFRSIFEHSHDGVFLLDPASDRICDANSRACAMLEYDYEELLSASISQIHPHDLSRFMAFTQSVLEKGEGWSDRLSCMTKNGRPIPAEISASLVTLPGRARIISIVRDVSERIEHEKSRERLICELEEKNAELQQFTYTVSHDLKSPLVSIQGFVGLLQKDLTNDRPDRIEDDLRNIRYAAKSMDILLNDLLELSRIGRDALALEELDVASLAKEVASRTASSMLGKIRLEVVASMPTTRADRGRILQVYQNLFENGIKYMGDQPCPLIQAGAFARDSQTIYYVEDNGIGIEPAYRERIFRLFEQLDVSSVGSGAGLAIVKRIVELHGGEVWVESDGPGCGSRFCFTVESNPSVPETRFTQVGRG